MLNKYAKLLITVFCIKLLFVTFPILLSIVVIGIAMVVTAVISWYAVRVPYWMMTGKWH